MNLSGKQKGGDLQMININQTFAEGWEGYQALASYDQDEWFRVPTRYDNGELLIEHTL